MNAGTPSCLSGVLKPTQEGALHMFSSTMAELYARAADTGPREFLEEAVQLVRRLIGFDGAVFGIEDADAMRVKDLVIDKAFADRIVASLRGDYVDVAISNFMPRAFCSAPGRPIAFDRKNLDGKLALSPWCDFAREHGIRRLLLYGDLPTEHYNARWIVLYRLEGPDFQEAEAQLLQAAWRHLRQAIAFNLSCALYRSDLHRRTRAMALIHSDGHVEIANKAMTDMLKIEWPDSHEGCLPTAAMAALIQSGTYHGKHIELTGSLKFGYMACVAKRTSLTRSLTQSELNVAHRFARGMTHKEIATHFNVSPHTVRNQLAHIYAKLGVHGKAELAQLMYNA